MSDENKVNETDRFVVEIMALMIGSAVIADPKRQSGLNEALLHIKQHFAGMGLNKAAAMTEHVRQKTTDNRSDPTLLNMLRDRPPGSGQPN